MSKISIVNILEPQSIQSVSLVDVYDCIPQPAHPEEIFLGTAEMNGYFSALHYTIYNNGSSIYHVRNKETVL